MVVGADRVSGPAAWPAAEEAATATARLIVRRRPRESEIVRQCLKALAWARIPAWAINQTWKDGRRSLGTSSGVSDIIAVQPGTGRLVALEVKVPGGKQSAQQADFGDEVKRCGGVYAVVESPEEALAAARRA